MTDARTDAAQSLTPLFEGARFELGFSLDDHRMVVLGLRTAFAAGAKGVVSKGDQAGDVPKAVLLASRGKTYTSPVFVSRADGRDLDDLSPKQPTALRLLAQGLERKAIAEKMGIGEETVKMHPKRPAHVRRPPPRRRPGGGAPRSVC